LHAIGPLLFNLYGSFELCSLGHELTAVGTYILWHSHCMVYRNPCLGGRGACMLFRFVLHAEPLGSSIYWLGATFSKLLRRIFGKCLRTVSKMWLLVSQSVQRLYSTSCSLLCYGDSIM